MEAEIIQRDNDNITIEWDNGGQFGNLSMKYNGKGSYIIDAEYVGINTVIEIFKAVRSHTHPNDNNN